MIAPGQRHAHPGAGDKGKAKKTEDARALVTLMGDRALMVTLLTVTNLRTNRPKAGTAWPCELWMVHSHPVSRDRGSKAGRSRHPRPRTCGAVDKTGRRGFCECISSFARCTSHVLCVLVVRSLPRSDSKSEAWLASV